MIFARGVVAEDFCGAHVQDRTLRSSKFPRLAAHQKS